MSSELMALDERAMDILDVFWGEADFRVALFDCSTDQSSRSAGL